MNPIIHIEYLTTVRANGATDNVKKRRCSNEDVVWVYHNEGDDYAACEYRTDVLAKAKKGDEGKYNDRDKTRPKEFSIKKRKFMFHPRKSI